MQASSSHGLHGGEWKITKRKTIVVGMIQGDIMLLAA